MRLTACTLKRDPMVCYPTATIRPVHRLAQSSLSGQPQSVVVYEYEGVIDNCIFWGCLFLMCAGFVLPGLGQIGATILLIRT